MKTLSCSDAKHIPIAEYLTKQGIRPIYIKGNDYWYQSPLRDEMHPSFKVNTKLNAWYDHGTGEGGSIIDLGIRLHGCSVSEFLQILASADAYLSLHQSELAISGKVKEEPKIIIKEATSLHSVSLISYLNQRGISLSSANRYCKEVHFSIADRNYYAVGFPNRSGGYELRNSWFKGSFSPKDISFIDNGSTSVCLFEGFVDFLSLLELKQHQQSHANFLILNSVSLLSRSLDVLRNHQEVFLLLNNDPAGKKAAEKIKESGIEGIDAGKFYKDFKDINEYLQARSVGKSRGMKI